MREGGRPGLALNSHRMETTYMSNDRGLLTETTAHPHDKQPLKNHRLSWKHGQVYICYVEMGGYFF